MQRGTSILAVALCIQLVIARALAMRKDRLASRPPNSAFVTAPIANADRIVVEGKPPAGKPADSARVDMVKENGAWVVESAYGMPVAANKADELLKRLAALRRGLPIADTAGALKRFKVSRDDFERRVTVSRAGKALATIYLGETSGPHKTDARTGGAHAVYAVDLPVYELPTDANGWFDDELLQVPPDVLAGISLGGAGQRTEVLTRQFAANKAPGPWELKGLAKARQVDDAVVSALTRAIAELRVEAALGDQPNPAWRTNEPVLTLTIENTAGKSVTWTIAKPQSGDFDVLKSSDHPWYFSLTDAEVKPLLDAYAPGALIAKVEKAAKMPKTGAKKPATPAKMQHTGS